MTQRSFWRPRLDWNATQRPSADQNAFWSSRMSVVSRRGWEPSTDSTQMSHVPVRLDWYNSAEPSGDQALAGLILSKPSVVAWRRWPPTLSANQIVKRPFSTSWIASFEPSGDQTATCGTVSFGSRRRGTPESTFATMV
jgi:hypothetical protein